MSVGRRPVVVFVNRDSGGCAGESTVQELQGLLAARELQATVVVVDASKLTDSVRSRLSAEPTLVVAAGGDGTVRSVAAVLAGTAHVLGVLPLGTVNHLARDLQLPLDLAGAVDELVRGEDRPIDVGMVNGELFLNACVLGVYADLVQWREARRRRLRRRWRPVRWLSDTTASAWQVLSAWKLLRFELRIDGEQLRQRVPLVVVANNPLPRLTEPRSLDRGQLAIYVPKHNNPVAVALTMLRALLLGPTRVATLSVHHVERATIELSSSQQVVVDGEVLELPPPLELRCLPAACTVRAPAAARALKVVL